MARKKSTKRQTTKKRTTRKNKKVAAICPMNDQEIYAQKIKNVLNDRNGHTGHVPTVKAVCSRHNVTLTFFHKNFEIFHLTFAIPQAKMLTQLAEAEGVTVAELFVFLAREHQKKRMRSSVSAFSGSGARQKVKSDSESEIDDYIEDKVA